MSTLLTEKQAAERLSLSLATLRRRRMERRPPGFVKIGASVRYRPEDVEAFIEASVVKGGGKNQEDA
jgi:predicted DNA-binding transcriptional regulator AlpA